MTALAKAVRQLSDPAVLRVLAKSLLVTLAVFVVLGTGLYFALKAGFAYFGIEGAGMAEAALALLIGTLAFWFLFRVVAIAVLQFFADEIVAMVEIRHYPGAAQHVRALPFRQDIANSLRGIGRALGYNLLVLPIAAVLLVTGVGSAIVFLLVNAVLLGRELTDMAWLRHDPVDPRANPVGFGSRFALGAIIAGLMLVPVAGLLAPVMGAAAGTHLTHQAMLRRGDKMGEEPGDAA
ncbi:MAG: EI24 domain-containing protein [Erythrobacter sp.]